MFPIRRQLEMIFFISSLKVWVTFPGGWHSLTSPAKPPSLSRTAYIHRQLSEESHYFTTDATNASDATFWQTEIHSSII
jgi:hypothetical protein